MYTGRFMSRDPIGVWGDAGNMGNEYAYAWNRPLVVGDRFGLQGDDGGGAARGPGYGLVYKGMVDQLGPFLQALLDRVVGLFGDSANRPGHLIDGKEYMDSTCRRLREFEGEQLWPKLSLSEGIGKFTIPSELQGIPRVDDESERWSVSASTGWDWMDCEFKSKWDVARRDLQIDSARLAELSGKIELPLSIGNLPDFRLTVEGGWQDGPGGSYIGGEFASGGLTVGYLSNGVGESQVSIGYRGEIAPGLQARFSGSMVSQQDGSEAWFADLSFGVTF